MSCSSPKEQDPLLTTRGVKNPKVLDLIKVEAASDSVVLVMIEDRPWEHNPERLEELSAKFNTYLDYVVDGWLVKQYPQYEGKHVIFELSSKDELSGFYTQMCEQMRLFADKSGYTFRVTSEPPPSLS
jgi:hypothetical protein